MNEDVSTYVAALEEAEEAGALPAGGGGSRGGGGRAAVTVVKAPAASAASRLKRRAATTAGKSAASRPNYAERVCLPPDLHRAVELFPGSACSAGWHHSVAFSVTHIGTCSPSSTILPCPAVKPLIVLCWHATSGGKPPDHIQSFASGHHDWTRLSTKLFWTDASSIHGLQMDRGVETRRICLVLCVQGSSGDEGGDEVSVRAPAAPRRLHL